MLNGSKFRLKIFRVNNHIKWTKETYARYALEEFNNEHEHYDKRQ